MSEDTIEERITSNERISFDTSTDKTIQGPQQSQHWQSLLHQESDKWIHNLDELKDRFRSDVQQSKHSKDNGGQTMALWSCITGYCEALATHKEDTRRYSIFPIPLDALARLVQTEFRQKVLAPAQQSTTFDSSSCVSLEDPQKHHRVMLRAVANAVWDTALSSSKKDEEHANSLYVCLRGHIDRKSIDCVGSSVTTVAGAKMLQSEISNTTKVTSMLTLSEDHVYERHLIQSTGTEGIATLEGTCEVAIPGSTKRQKDKRACEIADTFKEKKACVLLTPESSWLYMASNPVVCSDTPMSLVPIIANINCNIRSKPPGSTSNSKGSSLESKQLYRLKRELLWILYDERAMQKFPFGILELGDCEATLGSKRGEEWVQSKSSLIEHSEPILKNEELFLEAIEICKTNYNDAQVYPYYYLGHYHKDAGGADMAEDTYNDGNNDSPLFRDNEHRFADALRMYSEMARVTSKYRFDTGDCLQLNKHLTAVAPLIYEDILTTSAAIPKSRVPRKWIHECNAKACCFWLLRLLDYLLYWEEWSSSAASKVGLVSKNPRFVEILQPSHKSFLGKLLQMFSSEVRQSALDDYFAGNTPTVIGGTKKGQDQTQTKYTVSKRLGNPSTLLAKALRSAKVQIRDMELMILDDDDDATGGRRKRRRRS